MTWTEKNSAEAGPGTVPRVSPPGPGELFMAFLVVGLSGFGGVLPFARRMLVEQRRWVTPLEFTELLSVAQFLPGANVVNLTIGVGTRFAGLAGAVAAFAGLISMPIVIVLLLGSAYARYGDLPFVAQGFQGLASAAAGLVVAMAARIAWPVARSPRVVVLAAAIFLAIVGLRLPLVWVLLGLVPVALLWARIDRDA
jgi:chromate transporter